MIADEYEVEMTPASQIRAGDEIIIEVGEFMAESVTIAKAERSRREDRANWYTLTAEDGRSAEYHGGDLIDKIKR